MSKLIIGNQLTEETVEGPDALPADYTGYLGEVSHRLVWLAEEQDVLVLPSAPDPRFLAYVWQHLGFIERVPAILVPPAGRRDDHLLYDDRLADPGFLEQLSALLAERDVDEVHPFYYDAAVRQLAAALGLAGTVAGEAFLAQGGAEFVNSKSHFRAIAAGNGAGIPPGRVSRSVEEVEQFAWALLAEGQSVIVKQDVHGGGYGNEILIAPGGVAEFGAARITTLADRLELASHLRERWSVYTQNGRHPVIAEHYLVGSIPLYIEFLAVDDEVQLVGYGEMRTKQSTAGPTNAGLVVPPSTSTKLPGFATFVADARRIVAAAHAIGYRGHMSIDAIATADGRILFNEFNGRISGSTHIHRIGDRLLGDDYLQDRVLLVRSHRDAVITTALAELPATGLAYDPASRTGVLITGDDGQFLIVAESLDDAIAREDALIKAFELAVA